MMLKQKDVHFLFQSFISGIMEVGFVYYLWQLNYSIIVILIFALLYQATNFLASFLIADKKIIYLSILIFIANVLYIILNNTNIYCLGVIFFIVSIFLQILRGEAKSSVSTFIKRTFRILGFVNFYLFGIKFLLAVAIYVFIMIFKYNELQHKAQTIKIKYSNILPSIIMITHQIHYFIYCYILMYFLLQNVDNILLYGFIFSLGWITYLVSQNIFGNFNIYKNVIIGHLVLSCNIFLLFCVIYFRVNLYIIWFLWILTGFSAGTVFAIKDILIIYKHNLSSINFYENIGHVFAVILSLAVVIATSNIYNTIIISALFALLTAILTYVLYGKNYARN
ncbi:MAG: hypothetical protein FWE18_00310 [Alphaproteobacteria bacterium]|nr:hypothetical protein [Alphaproteobacteria bacterium]